MSGNSVLAIIRELTSQGIKSPTGKDHWNKRAIETMLSNEKYVGNVLVGKTYCADYPNNQRLVNKGLQRGASLREKGLKNASESGIIKSHKHQKAQHCWAFYCIKD